MRKMLLEYKSFCFSFERKHIKKEVAVNIAYGWSCAVFPGCRLHVRCFTYKIHRIGAYVLLPFPAFLIFITQYTSTVSLEVVKRYNLKLLLISWKTGVVGNKSFTTKYIHVTLCWYKHCLYLYPIPKTASLCQYYPTLNSHLLTNLPLWVCRLAHL